MTTSTSDGKIGVLVVDDHPVVLTGLAAMISADPALRVVGTAQNVAKALALPEKPAPDVCVLDLNLPDGDGVSLGTSLKQRWPETRVLVLTMSADPGAVMRSLGKGHEGYMLKDSDPQELLAAINAVANGALVLGRGTSAPIVSAASALPSSHPLAALDARDREILGLLVQGLSANQIASRLFLAPKTIRNRTSDMLTKLGVATREEAIAIGLAGGLGN